jgi:acyl-CoA oxidase
MIDSPIVKSNPTLLVFVPILYTVWSDSILTPSEVSTLEGLIDSQSWLTEVERKFLASKINPSNPPSVDELMAWKAAISEVTDKNNTNETLVSLGIRLSNFHSNGNGTNETLTKARPTLEKIESALGVISNEASYTFQLNRKTVTSEQTTKQNFSVAELTKILDGEHAAIIKKVKTVISDPDLHIETQGQK